MSAPNPTYLYTCSRSALC